VTRVLRVAAIAVAVSIGTWGVGWWAPAVVSVLAGYLFAADRVIPTLTGLGAMLGWGIVLVVDAVGGRLATVATVMGAIFNRGPVPLLVLTLLVPLLVGLTGAELGRWLRARLGAPPAGEGGR
jgi:hypothetical protein